LYVNTTTPSLPIESKPSLRLGKCLNITLLCTRTRWPTVNVARFSSLRPASLIPAEMVLLRGSTTPVSEEHSHQKLLAAHGKRRENKLACGSPPHVPSALLRVDGSPCKHAEDAHGAAVCKVKEPN
jgi:hypothetical protein